MKRMHQREDLIDSLKQGARLLEDQLNLMDARYLELRGKLDYTKASSDQMVRKVTPSSMLRFTALASLSGSSDMVLLTLCTLRSKRSWRISNENGTLSTA